MKASLAVKATGESSPHPRGRVVRVRRLLSAALLLVGGYVFGVSMLGGCGGGATWPTNGQLPDRMIEKLAECGKRGPIPLESTTYNLSFIVRVTEGVDEVHVEEVLLKDSTLKLEEVESCMADALHGMRAPLQVLALRRRSLAPETPMSPETRALLGQAQVVPLMEVTGLVFVGLAVYAVVVYILEETRHPKRRPHPTTSEPATTVEPLVTAAPLASAAPTTTAVPIATAVPTTVPVPNVVALKPHKNEKMCDELAVECLENQKQPKRRVKQWGKLKNCKDCQQECYDQGEWPDYKCPRP